MRCGDVDETEGHCSGRVRAILPVRIPCVLGLVYRLHVRGLTTHAFKVGDKVEVEDAAIGADGHQMLRNEVW
jgi:hypothetical protein